MYANNDGSCIMCRSRDTIFSTVHHKTSHYKIIDLLSTNINIRFKSVEFVCLLILKVHSKTY